jgi:hypothetical protein
MLNEIAVMIVLKLLAGDGIAIAIVQAFPLRETPASR